MPLTAAYLVAPQTSKVAFPELDPSGASGAAVAARKPGRPGAVWAVSLIAPIPDRRSGPGVAFGQAISVHCPPVRNGLVGGENIPTCLAGLNVRWRAIGGAPIALERALAEDIRASRLTEARKEGAIPFERFLSRPVSEAELMSVWPLLGRDILNDDFAGKIVGSLTGGPVHRRIGQISSAPDRFGRCTLYAQPDIAAGWIDRINGAEAIHDDPFILACHAYAEVALSHPYADGNGRLARAMYQRAFARAGLLDAPLIPLGPLIYLNHKVVIAALVRLGTTGDWPPFLDLMARLTHKAVAFTRHHLKSHSRSPRDIDGP